MFQHRDNKNQPVDKAKENTDQILTSYFHLYPF